MEAEIEHRMKETGVRPSPVRNMVLQTIYKVGHPLTAREIEDSLGTVDRSSISRALAVFQDSGLVHCISDGTAADEYEFCREPHDDSHTDEHVHFHCEICGRTICLHETKIPQVPIPAGFTAKSANFVISGVCNKCNAKLLLKQ